MLRVGACLTRLRTLRSVSSIIIGTSTVAPSWALSCSALSLAASGLLPLQRTPPDSRGQVSVALATTLSAQRAREQRGGSQHNSESNGTSTIMDMH
eukprot:649638-Rhodomonas_salina.1